MLGQKDFKPQLFHTIQLEDLVPRDHELRHIMKVIDFGVVRYRVKDKYSYTGQPGIDPVVIIKMLFLGYYYGINSERKLAKDIVLNNAYRWFLGYDLDEAPPTHSVLSKARTRYGIEVFQSLFDHVVGQCVDAGLVSGKKAFIDASLIEANASEESLVPRIQVMTAKEYAGHMMSKEQEESPKEPPLLSSDKNQQGPENLPQNFNDRMVSQTDPDASFIDRGKKAGLNYEGHYLVDGKNKIIVGVTTTDTVDNASNYAPELVQRALFRHGLKYKSLCADAEYGTQSLYAFLFRENILPYIPTAESGRKDGGKLFHKSEFAYDERTDSYICPAGNRLERDSVNRKKQQVQYQALATHCRHCSLQSQCTTSKQGRKVTRLFYEESVQRVRELMATPEYLRQMKERRIVVEPLFSEAKECHGLRRAKYRRKWRVSIQVLWTATVQNIKRLMKMVTRPPRLVVSASVARATKHLQHIYQLLISLLNCQRTFSYC